MLVSVQKCVEKPDSAVVRRRLSEDGKSKVQEGRSLMLHEAYEKEENRFPAQKRGQERVWNGFYVHISVPEKSQEEMFIKAARR